MKTNNLVRDAVLARFPKLDTKISESGDIMLFKNGKYLISFNIDFLIGKAPTKHNKELEDKVETILRNALYDMDLD